MAQESCSACGYFGVVDRAHLKTRGSGAGWDPNEWIYLCRRHHVMQGQIGWHRFATRFPVVMREVERRGWKFVMEFGSVKLRRV